MAHYEGMRDRILKTLADWEGGQGWEVWVEIAQQEGVSDKDRLVYRRFKQAITDLQTSALIEPQTEHRQRARTVWRLTPAGWEKVTADDGAGDEPEELDLGPYIAKRMRGEKPIPRPVWKALLGQVRRGELDIVFMLPKGETKTTGGSGR